MPLLLYFITALTHASVPTPPMTSAVEITQRKPSFYIPGDEQQIIPKTIQINKTPATKQVMTPIKPPTSIVKKLEPLKLKQAQAKKQDVLTFDLPITYNNQVKDWIQFYQTRGRRDFARWLERSQRYLPHIQEVFRESGLPNDLAYLAMVESGFSPFAISPADAVGYWQFIEPTAQRFGLTVNWWLDERRDIVKSTKAAALYLKKLHDMFDSWYLAIAAYNTGENRIKRLVEKHQTKNFWTLAEREGLVSETKNYIPKILATVLISKAPPLYGFRGLNYQKPTEFEYFWAPGGFSLTKLAAVTGLNEKELSYLNPELVRKFVPDSISGYRIRIPKNSSQAVAQFVRKGNF